MAEFPALPLWTDAYIADTQHLTNEEHGVYLRLLMFAWRTPDCALPDDDRRLAIMVGVTPKKWATLRASIMSFWTLSEGVWTQKKLTSERVFVEIKRKQKSAAGKASSNAKSLKCKETGSTVVDDPLVTAGATERQQPIPIPIPIPSKGKEETNVSSKKRGTRLPDDWEPDRMFASREGLSPSEVNLEADKFRDYWVSVPGQKGVKLDWDAVWRNWIRKVAADRNKSNSRAETTDWRKLPEYRGVL